MTDSNPEKKPHSNETLLQRWARLVGLTSAVFLVCMYLFWLWWSFGNDLIFINTMMQHLLAVVGIPGSAIAAFVLIVVLKQTSGPIEFEALGFKFKGASGQVAMWLAVFLALVLSLKLLW